MTPQYKNVQWLLYRYSLVSGGRGEVHDQAEHGLAGRVHRAHGAQARPLRHGRRADPVVHRLLEEAQPWGRSERQQPERARKAEAQAWGAATHEGAQLASYRAIKTPWPGCPPSPQRSAALGRERQQPEKGEKGRRMQSVDRRAIETHRPGSPHPPPCC